MLANADVLFMRISHKVDLMYICAKSFNICLYKEKRLKEKQGKFR